MAAAEAPARPRYAPRMLRAPLVRHVGKQADYAHQHDEAECRLFYSLFFVVIQKTPLPLHGIAGIGTPSHPETFL